MRGPAECAGLLGLELGQELGQKSGTRPAPWQARGGGFNRSAHSAGPASHKKTAIERCSALSVTRSSLSMRSERVTVYGTG